MNQTIHSDDPSMYCLIVKATCLSSPNHNRASQQNLTIELETDLHLQLRHIHKLLFSHQDVKNSYLPIQRNLSHFLSLIYILSKNYNVLNVGCLILISERYLSFNGI
jgi:hypothetical protein